LKQAIKRNPFPEAEADPRSLHLGFLAYVPKKPDVKKLESLKKESGRFYLIEDIFCLHAPESVGRSKLAASSEKLLGVPMTDRNWNTVCRLRDMGHKMSISAERDAPGHAEQFERLRVRRARF
jgi:uncharacterized protein (DUF1697 family)